MQERRLTPGLLLFSICILVLLIPGGPIDNRTMPDMPLLAALSLSLLINILTICAIFSVFQTRRGGRQALYRAAWEGGGFATIYLVDLAEILPSTPPMGVVVKIFDIVGLAFAVLLIVSVMRDLRRPMPETQVSFGMTRVERVSLIAFSVYIGAILTFIGTVAAISRSPGLYLLYGMR
jgi:hypothetical protein